MTDTPDQECKKSGVLHAVRSRFGSVWLVPIGVARSDRRLNKSLRAIKGWNGVGVSGRRPGKWSGVEFTVERTRPGLLQDPMAHMTSGM